ncbi:MAG: peptidase inhibitor I78, partial [Phenylobacterium sp.]|nr:peptidase inhibitor I78 [Phenylobacterium sp.]
MKAWIVAIAVAALAGCSTPADPEPPPPPPAAPEPAPAPPPVADSCGAAKHQYLVGRPRSEIPVPVKPEQQRVACTTCPVTM